MVVIAGILRVYRFYAEPVDKNWDYIVIKSVKSKYCMFVRPPNAPKYGAIIPKPPELVKIKFVKELQPDIQN
jgi:hypothetical protein